MLVELGGPFSCYSAVEDPRFTDPGHPLRDPQFNIVPHGKMRMSIYRRGVLSLHTPACR